MQYVKLICRFFSWLTVDETFFTTHDPRDLAVASSLTQLFLSCFGKLGMQVERLNPHCWFYGYVELFSRSLFNLEGPWSNWCSLDPAWYNLAVCCRMREYSCHRKMIQVIDNLWRIWSWAAVSLVFLFSFWCLGFPSLVWEGWGFWVYLCLRVASNPKP
jgi:hypothetical protein